MRSYIVKYRSTDGKSLIGGVNHSQSSRWAEKADAEQYMATVKELNGPHCHAEIEPSNKPPELFRHCPVPSMPGNCVGARCFVCGKELTLEDAKNAGRRNT